MSIIKMVFSFILKSLGIFWKYFRNFQSFVGTLLFLGLMVIIFVSIFSGKSIDVPKNGALLVSMEGPIVEQKIFNSSPAQALAGGNVRRQTILRDVIKAIDLGAKDERISMMILDVNGFGGALPSKLHYIGEALSRFRASGKKIVTYGNSFSQGGYLMASYADEIYLNPYGVVMLQGYGSYQNYYKNFLDKIKVEVQLFRVGKYKSAMEPFIRNDMSAEAKEASQALMDGLWSEYSASVSNGRDINEGDFTSGFENIDTDLVALKGDLGEYALQKKLVNGLKTREEWRQYLAQQLDVKSKELKDKVIGHRAYLMANDNGLPSRKDMIAVVYANGTIMDGKQPQGTAGGDTVSRHLREARLNDKVKAVILRVDSPGGSAFASEVIRQEVLSLKEAGKPVVVSMGSLAASGGYWISANANEIWAAPTTITGSIGIFGAVPNLEGTLAAIGISTDGVGTTSVSGASITRPLPEKLKTVLQSSIENGYDRFLNIVAEGRNMTVEQVHEIAQGRVWTGNQALKLGLVDKLGTFEGAVASAAKLANMTDYKIAYWEDPIPWEAKLINDFIERKGTIGKMIMAKTVGPQDILAARILKELSIFNQMNDPNHAYVLCLGCMASFGDEQ